MPKLIIGNGFSEAIVGDTSRNSLDVRQTASVEARRLSWLADNDDLIILPSPVSQKFIGHINNIMGKNLTMENFVFSSGDVKNPELITGEVLLSNDFIGKLKSLIESPENWYILPYHKTSAIYLLGEIMGFEEVGGPPSFMNQSGADLLNSKADFRSLFSSTVKIAEGVVCRTAIELYQYLKIYLNRYPTVIVKQNMNASGDGNLLITLTQDGMFAGIRDIYYLSKTDNLTFDFASKLWTELSDSCGNNQIILEEYVANNKTLYAEYEITDKGACKMLSNGIVRMEGSGDKRGKGIANWVGFEVPYKERAKLSSEFIVGCNKLASRAAELGYIGKINFDAIVTNDSRVLFTEVNGRLGGCTHVHVIASELIGQSYVEEVTIITRNRVKIKNLDRAIHTSQTLTNNQKDSGIVILNEDMSSLGTIEYMVYSTTKRLAIDLEKHFLFELDEYLVEA